MTHTAHFHFPLFFYAQNHFSHFSLSDQFVLVCTEENLIVPTIVNFPKIKKGIGRFFWFQKSIERKFHSKPCFQLEKIIDLRQFEKSQQVSFSEKEGEALSAI